MARTALTYQVRCDIVDRCGTCLVRGVTGARCDKGKILDPLSGRLSPEDIDACRRFVEPFGLPYYPGFEPHVGSFAGDRPE